MTMTRCDRTDLPTDQCGGSCCRPDLTEPGEVNPASGPPWTLGFARACDTCGVVMQPGETVTWLPGVRQHTDTRRAIQHHRCPR